MKTRIVIFGAFAMCGVLVGACSEAEQAVTHSAETSALSTPVTPKAEADKGAAPAKALGTEAGEGKANKPATVMPAASQAKTPEVPFEGRRIALVHTANVVGELEPCG